jgi:hypothetical protein
MCFFNIYFITILQCTGRYLIGRLYYGNFLLVPGTDNGCPKSLQASALRCPSPPSPVGN